MGELQTVDDHQKANALAPVQEPANLLHAIIAAASNPAVDVTKFERMLALKRELELDQAKREFSAAFKRISEKMPRVKKDGTISLGGKGKIAFARWEDMDKLLRPIITAEGCGLTFNTETGENGKTTVTAVLIHENGQSRSTSVQLSPDAGPGRNALQAIGSMLSYGKRYATELLLNIVREGQDDDGKKGGMSFLTPEQVKELDDELKTIDAAWHPTFFQMMGVSKLEDIAQGAYAPARNMIQAKKRQKAKGAS